MNEFEKAMTKNMSKSEKRKYSRFNSLCKQASKCRRDRGEISCYSCKRFENCYIQAEMKNVKP